ncbi:uncharacterized protein RJT21DRAFT_18917 [Scheffersomyces amazonensis]|uniref:uncharacterized protein n=1 Tax=Scheffersomyces amazonensis TaxID=1078765 RepID=UPI00315D7B4F
METRRGLLTKLGIYGGVAISLFLVGKKHIEYSKNERHKKETDARIDSEVKEFGTFGQRPGFPSNNPTMDYTNDPSRVSRYEGSGNSYSSRRPGDRLGFFSVLNPWSADNKEEDQSKYYKPPSRS